MQWQLSSANNRSALLQPHTLRVRDECALLGQKMSYVRDSLTGAAFMACSSWAERHVCVCE